MFNGMKKEKIDGQDCSKYMEKTKNLSESENFIYQTAANKFSIITDGNRSKDSFINYAVDFKPVNFIKEEDIIMELTNIGKHSEELLSEFKILETELVN